MDRVQLRLLVALVLGVCPSALRSASKPEKPVRLPPVVVAQPAFPLVPIDLGFRLRTPRFAAAAVSTGDYIYVIGGSNSADTRLNDIERLNLRTHTSEPFGKLKIGRRNHRAVYYRGKVYVIGGFPDVVWKTDQPFERSVEIIDPVTGKITLGPPLPEGRANFACAAMDGKIYVIGGARARSGSIRNTNTTWVLDVDSGKWSEGVPMFTPRMATAVVVNGFIIVAGGYTGHRETAEVEVFNPRDQAWRILPKLNAPLNPSSVSFLGHQLFLFGARELSAYDLNLKRSATFLYSETNPREVASVVESGKIFLIGGSRSKQPITMENYFHTGEVERDPTLPKGAQLTLDENEATDAVEVVALRAGQ